MVQAKLIDTCVESARFQCLKLNYDKLLSSFAFNYNLRHCNDATALP